MGSWGEAIVTITDGGARTCEADPFAILELEAKRGQALYGFARRLGLSDEDAADAVQEALLRVWAMLSRGQRIRDLDAMSFRILFRVAMDQHRLRRRVAELVGRLTSVVRENPPVSLGADLRGDVWAAVDLLPPRQKSVLYLRYQADLPYEQIGFTLGISASAARAHASLGLATLRRRLGREETP
jgi:RNA polymerase sigma factor (sigma-70 family)